MTEQERREHYLSHGICPHCGRNDLQAGYKRCLECRMKDNEAHRNKPITEERKAYQREYQREYNKKLREKRKAAGICVRCGKRSTDSGHTNCVYCRAQKAARQREYNRRNGRIPVELRGEGFCSRCFKPSESRLCPECYEYLVGQAALMREKQNNKDHIWRRERFSGGSKNADT